MPMPEFMVGYACGFKSVVFGVVLSELLFPRKKAEMVKMMKKVSSKVIFVLFLISVTAMDSENMIIPGVMCLVLVCLLYIGYRIEMSKKKESVATDSIKKTFCNCIITQGKEKGNGKMRDLRRKLRQWRTNRRSLPGMLRRGKTETDEG